MKKPYKKLLVCYFERRLAEVAPGFIAVRLPKEHAYQSSPTYVRRLDERHWLVAVLYVDPRPGYESFCFDIGWSDKASVPANEGGPAFSVDNASNYMSKFGQQRLRISPHRGGPWDFEPVFNKLPHQLEAQPLSKERAKEVVEEIAGKAFDLFIEQALPVFAEYEARWKAGKPRVDHDVIYSSVRNIGDKK